MSWAITISISAGGIVAIATAIGIVMKQKHQNKGDK